MSKALWKGTLSLGLVNIPVRLFPETRARAPALTLVDRRDMAPIGLTRINRKTGEEVPREQVARAAAGPDGTLVIVPDELLEEPAGDGRHAVRIIAFTTLAEISPAYFQAPYFLEPAAEGEKGYAILLEALRRTGKAAVARTVLLHGERIAALWADHSLLLMSVLRRPGELRRPARMTREPAPPEREGVSPEEIEAAERLIGTMTAPWDPRRFRDDSRERVADYVEQQAAPAPPVPQVTPQGQILKFLERSVGVVQEHKRARPSRTA